MGMFAVDPRIAIGGMTAVALARRFAPRKAARSEAHGWLEPGEVVRSDRLSYLAPEDEHAGEYVSHLDGDFAELNGWTAAQLDSHIALAKRPGALSDVLVGFALMRVTESGNPVGFIGVQDAEPGGLGAPTLSWHIAESARGSGYPLEAVSTVVSRLADKGWTELHVVVQELNQPVRSVVEALRYERIGREKIYLPDGRLVPAIRFACIGSS